MEGYKTYSVSIRRNDGVVIKKTIDAREAAVARNEGTRYGRVLNAQEVKPSVIDRLKQWWQRRKGFNQQRRIEFLHTMSNIQIGNTFPDSLEIMIQNFSGIIRDASRQVRQHAIIDQKDPIDAVGMLGEKYIPKVTVSIMRANAKATSLVEAFVEGLKFERDIGKMQANFVGKISVAMFKYVSTSAMMILIFFKGMQFMEDSGYLSIMPGEGTSQELLEDTQLLVDITGYFAMGTLGIWLAAFLFFGVAREQIPSTIERVALRTPVLRGFIVNRNSFLATYKIARLLEKNVELIPAFRYVGDDLEPGVLKDDFDRVLKSMSEGDQRFMDGFHSFSDLHRALLSSASKMEDMAGVFFSMSELFRESFENSLTTLVRIHDWMTNIMLGLLLWILTYVMYLPMVGGFDIIDKM